MTFAQARAMRKYLPLFHLLALCTGAAAQDSLKTIVGHITDRNGHNIEYVAAGIPGRNIGTVSDSEGRFTLELPDTTAADLMFFHVSYKEKSIPAAELIAATGPVTVILEENRLAAAVVTPGKRKDRRLVGKGARVPGGIATMEPSSTGMEIGSVIEVRKEFTIRKISLEVLRNALPGCVLGVNIYRTEGSPATFDNVLRKPIYCNIPVSDDKTKCEIEPEEIVVLSPGSSLPRLILHSARAGRLRQGTSGKMEGQAFVEQGGALRELSDIHRFPALPQILLYTQQGDAGLRTNPGRHRPDRRRDGTAMTDGGGIPGRRRYFFRPLLRRASAIIHWSCPLTLRNSSAAHFFRAAMVSASTRRTKLSVSEAGFRGIADY